MNFLASQALGKLLRRAENVHGKETAKSVTLRFSNASFPAYEGVATHEEKMRCHAELELARRAGAIDIQWERRAGDGNQVERIRLLDAAALAKFVGADPRWDIVGRAEQAMAEILVRYRFLAPVVTGWRAGRKVKGTSASDWERWLQAVRVLEHCRASTPKDVAVRRLSARLLGNSKKIEGLVPLLDVLLQEECSAPAREPEDVLHEIGLVKFPPAFLASGKLTVTTTKGKRQEPESYLGFPPGDIKGVAYACQEPRILTVENLTTFHELALAADDASEWVILYTGGMPPPSWKRAFNVFLKALPKGGPVWHWGDVDVGGFRIADHIAACCEAEGLTLRLHAMAPNESLSSQSEEPPRQLEPNELAAIRKVCERRGWSEEMNAVVAHPMAIEQELLPGVLPLRSAIAG